MSSASVGPCPIGAQAGLGAHVPLPAPQDDTALWVQNPVGLMLHCGLWGKGTLHGVPGLGPAARSSQEELEQGTWWWVLASRRACNGSVKPCWPARGVRVSPHLGWTGYSSSTEQKLSGRREVGGMAVAPSLPGRQHGQSQLHRRLCKLRLEAWVTSLPGRWQRCYSPSVLEGAWRDGRAAQGGGPSARAMATHRQKLAALRLPACFKMFIFKVQGNVSF